MPDIDLPKSQGPSSRPNAELSERLAVNAGARMLLTSATAAITGLTTWTVIYLLYTPASPYIGTGWRWMSFILSMLGLGLYLIVLSRALPQSQETPGPIPLFPASTDSSRFPFAVSIGAMPAFVLYLILTSPDGAQEKEGIKNWPAFYPRADRPMWFTVSLVVLAILAWGTTLYGLGIPTWSPPTTLDPISLLLDKISGARFRGKRVFGLDGSRALLISHFVWIIIAMGGLRDDQARLYLGSSIMATLSALGGLMGIREDLRLYE